MAIELNSDIAIDYIREDFIQQKNIRLGLLRLDKIHPVISGNKWFKLRENIRAAQASKCTSLLTFGGAYSNHLVATAAAARAMDMTSTGMVRGLHARDHLTPTLEACLDMGMALHFVNREEYGRKDDADYLHALSLKFPAAYVIPEGGNNRYGIAGATAIAAFLPATVSHVAVAIGTGTTFAGIRKGLPNTVNMIGFPVMKGGGYLGDHISSLCETENWTLNCDFHFGGFAKHQPALISFMNDFYKAHQIPLDFVYTAKMMYGIYELIKKGAFPEGSEIIGVHTGGLQGNASVSSFLCY